jgi:hypothetical protein
VCSSACLLACCQSTCKLRVQSNSLVVSVGVRLSVTPREGRKSRQGNYIIRHSQQPTANKYCASLYYLMRLERPVSVYIRPSSGSASVIDTRTVLIREEKAFTFTAS